MTSGNRPLSPHLQIYRPQINSLTSILHRMAGVALGLGVVLLAWWLIAAAGGADSFAPAQAFMGSIVGRIILFGFTGALFFHLCNGVRHLIWDAGYGLGVEAVVRGGWAVIATSGVLTLLAWVAGYGVRG